MKRESVEQEERLKRLSAKIQKVCHRLSPTFLAPFASGNRCCSLCALFSPSYSNCLTFGCRWSRTWRACCGPRRRKRGPVGQSAAATAVSKEARDEEVERLEAAIRDRQFHVDAMNKQMLIIKHTVSNGPQSRKPLSSIYGGDAASRKSSASQPRPKSAGVAAKKGPSSTLLSNTSDGDTLEIISALKRELSRAAERLHAAQQEAATDPCSDVGKHERKSDWGAKSVDELRKALEDLKAKTTMLEASEE